MFAKEDKNKAVAIIICWYLWTKLWLWAELGIVKIVEDAELFMLGICWAEEGRGKVGVLVEELLVLEGAVGCEGDSWLELGVW